METVASAEERDTKMINQMMLTKVLHIMDVVKGINCKSKSEIILNNIIDPTIVSSLARNIFETVGMFNLIYKNTVTLDERYIV